MSAWKFNVFTGTLDYYEASAAPGAHAASHTDGSDDIQDATNAQKGLATAAHITAIGANTTHISSDGSDHAFIDQDVTSGASPTLDGANITNIDADTLIADVKEANVSAVKKGQPCADVGSSGTKFLVQLADCDNASLINLLGLSDADVVQNETGTVVHKGLLTNVDTQTTNSDLNPGAETWAAGEMLYVSQIPGGLTKTRPTSGRCIKACRSLKGNSASDTLLAIVHTNSICACAASGEDICSRMGDSAGVNKHSFKDYGSNEVAAFDSNGNLTLSGTVDGRDVAADGTKLDGIEVAATADQTKADIDGLAITTVGTLDTGNADAVVTKATVGDINTGTEAIKVVTPDTLAGSNIGTKNVAVKCIADDTALTTSNGKAHFTVPIELNGMDLVSVGAHVYTVSSSGTPTFQIHNLTQTADMLSTVITIDANEKDSKDAATPAVIDGANDDVATGDELRFDCDVAGTSTAGMEIRMGFRLP